MKVENVVFRPILWLHDVKKNGQIPIYLYVGHGKDIVYFSTKYDTAPENWDHAGDYIKPSHPKYIDIIKKLDSLVEDIKFEIRLAGHNQQNSISLNEIKKRIKSKEKGVPELDKVEGIIKPMKILEFFNHIISELESEGNPGGADVFYGGRSPVRRFLGGMERDILFTDFNESKCKAFEAFLRGLDIKDTSISMYLRTFYRLWNLAGEKGYHPNDPNKHPSKFIKFRAYRRIRTQKRAIPVSVFQAIAKLKFPYESRMFRSQQYILFSYYARGINFNDLCKLQRKRHIIGDSID